jgi:ubiquinol-cytochrome c reductase iron-sulfur subunit
VITPPDGDGDGDGGGHGTAVAVPVARFDDPHLQEFARHPARTERVIAVLLVVGMLAVAGFGAAYWVSATPWVLAVTFGAGLFFLGFGLTAWGKYLMPQGPFVEDRHTLASAPEEQDALSAALVQRTSVVVKRRRLLGGLFAGGAGIFGIVAIFPLLRSLGPLPGTSFDRTNWRRGTLLVDSNGRPVHVDTLEVGGILTVFPHGQQASDEGQAVDQTILLRVSTDDVTTQPGRSNWGPRGYLAYSKLCTHLGCPVGLYEQQLQLLVCPCHQSMFNVLNGCIPQFGPAPRPLPQLPLKVDASGYLRARAGYDQAVGPGFWERTTK